MSGAKKGTIDTRGSNALYSAAEDDYKWATTNFGPVMDSIRGFTDGQVDTAMDDPANAGLSRDEVAARVIKGNEQTQFRDIVAGNEALATQQVNGAERAAARSARRMGLRADSPEVAIARQRAQEFRRADTVANASNTTRAGLRDRSISRARAASSMGNAIKKLGLGNLEVVSQMENDRNKQNAQNVRGGLVGALTGALSGAASGGAVGGPIGAVIGGLAGGMQGYN